MTVHVGATLERFPGDKYFAGLTFFEFAPRAPLPRVATLTRYRHQLSRQALVALRAPQSALVSDAGPLRPSAAQTADLAWLLDAADRLDAEVVVFPTPASLTPGQHSRKLLRSFAEALPRPEGRRYVWAPSGLWEEQDSAELAAGLGLVRAFDPLHEERPPGPIAYAHLRALGVQSSFSETVLADTLDKLTSQPTECGYISIHSDRSVQEAKRLRALLASADLADGGTVDRS